MILLIRGYVETFYVRSATSAIHFSAAPDFDDGCCIVLGSSPDMSFTRRLQVVSKITASSLSLSSPLRLYVADVGVNPPAE